LRYTSTERGLQQRRAPRRAVFTETLHLTEPARELRAVTGRGGSLERATRDLERLLAVSELALGELHGFGQGRERAAAFGELGARHEHTHEAELRALRAVDRRQHVRGREARFARGEHALERRAARRFGGVHAQHFREGRERAARVAELREAQLAEPREHPDALLRRRCFGDALEQRGDILIAPFRLEQREQAIVDLRRRSVALGELLPGPDRERTIARPRRAQLRRLERERARFFRISAGFGAEAEHVRESLVVAGGAVEPFEALERFGGPRRAHERAPGERRARRIPDRVAEIHEAPRRHLPCFTLRFELDQELEGGDELLRLARLGVDLR
jgi:hypothetical protein